MSNSKIENCPRNSNSETEKNEIDCTCYFESEAKRNADVEENKIMYNNLEKQTETNLSNFCDSKFEIPVEVKFKNVGQEHDHSSDGMIDVCEGDVSKHQGMISSTENVGITSNNIGAVSSEQCRNKQHISIVAEAEHIYNPMKITSNQESDPVGIVMEKGLVVNNEELSTGGVDVKMESTGVDVKMEVCEGNIPPPQVYIISKDLGIDKNGPNELTGISEETIKFDECVVTKEPNMERMIEVGGKSADVKEDSLIGFQDEEMRKNEEMENEEPLSAMDLHVQEVDKPQMTSSTLSSDSSSSSDDESTSDSDSPLDNDHDDKVDDDLIEEMKPKKIPPPPTTTTEMKIQDLPAVEYIKMVLDENVVLSSLGVVSSLIGQLVVIQSSADTPALDIDTVLFREDRQALGVVFEVFGPVQHPLYSMRYNAIADINELAIHLQLEVFYAPSSLELTAYVFTSQLLRIKGSDASWKGDEEPPPEFIDYSDDELERVVKGKKRRQRDPLKRKVPSQGVRLQGIVNDGDKYNEAKETPTGVKSSQHERHVYCNNSRYGARDTSQRVPSRNSNPVKFTSQQSNWGREWPPHNYEQSGPPHFQQRPQQVQQCPPQLQQWPGQYPQYPPPLMTMHTPYGQPPSLNMPFSSSSSPHFQNEACNLPPLVDMSKPPPSVCMSQAHVDNPTTHQSVYSNWTGNPSLNHYAFLNAPPPPPPT